MQQKLQQRDPESDSVVKQPIKLPMLRQDLAICRYLAVDDRDCCSLEPMNILHFGASQEEDDE